MPNKLWKEPTPEDDERIEQQIKRGCGGGAGLIFIICVIAIVVKIIIEVAK